MIARTTRRQIRQTQPPMPTLSQRPSFPYGYQKQGSENAIAQTDFAPIRKDFSDTTGIFLVMKTGVTEAFEKIPLQLMTALKCLHGGSGYVLSRSALGKFVGANLGIAIKYDVDMRNNCCSDYMFARAVKDTSEIDVAARWSCQLSPLLLNIAHLLVIVASLQRRKIIYYFSGLKTTDGYPIRTMHHMNSEEISAFWRFERRRYRTNKKPLLFGEVFDEFLTSKISSRCDDWGQWPR